MKEHDALKVTLRVNLEEFKEKGLKVREKPWVGGGGVAPHTEEEGGADLVEGFFTSS